MKLVIFILGLTLCTASPSFRILQDDGFMEPPGQIIVPTAVITPDNSPPTPDGFVEPPGQILEPGSPPEWLFEGSDPSTGGEENLSDSSGEDTPPTTDPNTPPNDPNGEGTIPEGNGTEGQGGQDEEQNKDFLTIINEDAKLTIIFDCGVKTVIESGIKKGKIPSKNFTVTNVTEMTTVTTTTVERYTFSCEILSIDRVSVIYMNFTVAHNLKTGVNTVPAFSYLVNTTTTTIANSTFVKLTTTQIAADEVQTMLHYGVGLVIQKGIQAGKIPASQYEISDVVSVERMIQKNKTTYKYNVELEDANQVLIQINFTDTINSQTNQKSLGNWSYHVSNIKFSINESAYVQVSPQEIQNNSVIMDCLEAAIQQSVNNPAFNLTNITAVYTQTVNEVVYYEFYVELSDGKKSVKLVATVAYQLATGEIDLKAFETTIITTTTTTMTSTMTRTSTILAVTPEN